MAKNVKSTTKEYRDSGKAFKGMTKDAFDFYRAVTGVEKGMFNIKEVAEALGDETSELVSLQISMNELVKKEAKERKGVENAFKRGLGLGMDKKRLLEAEENLTQAILTNDENAKKVAEEKIQALQEEAKLAGEVYDDILDLFPGLNAGLKFAGKLQALWNKITEMNIYVKIAAVLLAIGATLVGLVKQANSLSQEFGGGLKANIAIAGQLKLSTMRAKLFGLSAEQVRQSFDAIANTFGDVSVASARFSVDMAKVSRNTGVSAENVANLMSLFMPVVNGSRELALNMVDAVSEMAKAEGIAPGIIIDELASNADLFASFIGKGEKNLIKAAAAAKKVGVEFNGIVDLGDSLLSITERINKEQVASTIAQKQINLERFTALMAADKQVEAQEELARILKDVNLTEMRSQQRRLFAQALGVPLAELMRISGLRSGGMPMAGGAGASGMSAYEKQTLESEKNQEKYLKEIRNDLR